MSTYNPFILQLSKIVRKWIVVYDIWDISLALMQLSEETLIRVLSSIFTRKKDSGDAWPINFPIGDLEKQRKAIGFSWD